MYNAHQTSSSAPHHHIHTEPCASTEKRGRVTLHLTVKNHPGVMSHVCGLFARRSFNLEGILVTPENDATVCSMWLLVNDDKRLEQIMRQVCKLHDILDARVTDIDSNAFLELGRHLSAGDWQAAS